MPRACGWPQALWGPGEARQLPQPKGWGKEVKQTRACGVGRGRYGLGASRVWRLTGKDAEVHSPG